MSALLALLPDAWKPYAKTVVAVAAALAGLAAQVLPLLPEAAANVVTGTLAFLAALGVYAVPNSTVEEPADESYSDGAEV